MQIELTGKRKLVLNVQAECQDSSVPFASWCYSIQLLILCVLGLLATLYNLKTKSQRTATLVKINVGYPRHDRHRTHIWIISCPNSTSTLYINTNSKEPKIHYTSNTLNFSFIMEKLKTAIKTYKKEKRSTNTSISIWLLFYLYRQYCVYLKTTRSCRVMLVKVTQGTREIRP